VTSLIGERLSPPKRREPPDPVRRPNAMNIINPRRTGDPPCSAHTGRRTRAVHAAPLAEAVVVVVAAAPQRENVDVGTPRPTAYHVRRTASALAGCGTYARNRHRSGSDGPGGAATGQQHEIKPKTHRDNRRHRSAEHRRHVHSRSSDGGGR
jgi:hypothetical protein